MQIPKDPRLDLDDPETNYMAMLKMRADLAEKDCLFAFPGEAWVMVPQEKNHRCFKTFGIGASRIEEVEEGWRIFSREVLYYMDPETGEILETWNNPFLGGREVEVHHIANDPVNGVFARQGSPILSPPYPYVSHGDDVVFQWNFFIYKPAPLTRSEYPLYSSGDIDMHAELWGLKGRKSELLDPSITSASRCWETRPKSAVSRSFVEPSTSTRGGWDEATTPARLDPDRHGRLPTLLAHPRGARTDPGRDPVATPGKGRIGPGVPGGIPITTRSARGDPESSPDRAARQGPRAGGDPRPRPDRDGRRCDATTMPSIRRRSTDPS